MKRITVIAAVLAVGALVAAACGGSGAKPTASPAAVQSGTTGSTGTPGSGTQVAIGTGTPIAIVGSPLPTYTPSPVSDAQKTAVAQGPNVPLADFRDPNGRFVVGLPVGWTIEADRFGVNATVAGTPVGASLGISCTPGATVPALITADTNLFKNVGDGDMTLDKEFSTTVAGITAREIPWQGVVKDVNILVKHWFVYFEAKGCAWRLLLHTFPGVNEQEMLVIFRRMLDSFRLL